MSVGRHHAEQRHRIAREEQRAALHSGSLEDAVGKQRQVDVVGQCAAVARDEDMGNEQRRQQEDSRQ